MAKEKDKPVLDENGVPAADVTVPELPVNPAPEAPAAEPTKGYVPKALHFENGFWSPELKRCFVKGFYTCANAEEYKILKSRSSIVHAKETLEVKKR